MTLHTNRTSQFTEHPPIAVTWGARRIPLSHGRHTRGRVPVVTAAYAVDVESQLERDVVVFLCGIAGLRLIQSQPFTLRYVEAGRSRRYTPDLLVCYDRVVPRLLRLGFSTWTVIEVKPHDRWLADRDEISTRLTCVSTCIGLAAVCVTERDIGRGGQPS